ncbi:hypothetical protein BDR04DRAFT_1142485 [Suillus decipiens]|nr:hypothetical protein BDR04DRAFT_1142485 [Suillus decipiens]
MSMTAYIPHVPCRLPLVYLISSLERLKLVIMNPPEDRITSVRTAALRPLFAFRNLRKFDLTIHHRYISRWDDTVLLQMVEAWPLLEVLHLSSNRSRGGVTPNAFISLLQHCPCLISIAVIVDWSTIDGDHVSLDAPYRGFAHKVLSEAFFGSPRIRHPARIAASISAIAPNLESIVTWRNMEHHNFKKYSVRWRCVHDLIKTFSAVREQGRRVVTNTGEGADEKRGSYDHYGITQSAHETKHGDTTISGDDLVGSGSETSEQKSNNTMRIFTMLDSLDEESPGWSSDQAASSLS